MSDIVNTVLRNAVRSFSKREGDYEKDGILYCGKCGEPRQTYVAWPNGDNGNTVRRLVPVVCRCDKEEDAENERRATQERFETGLRRMRSAVDAQTAKWSFSDDEEPESKISKALRRYAERWPDMKKDNIGILLYGSKGTGKSFYASCLVNAIENKRESSALVKTAGLMATMQESWNRQDLLDTLCRFRFLALDDLGAERDTSYSAELMFSVIDARYRSGLPTAVTTNLDLSDMQRSEDRIFDRIIEMCPITIKMQGESRRRGIAESRKEKARDLLREAEYGN